MKKILSTLFVLATLFSFTNVLAQKQKAYVKFTQKPPSKLIKDDISTTDFFVEYKSKKEVTIYLELRNGSKILGNAIKTVKSKKPQNLKLNITTFEKIIPSSGYNYNLYMYEGAKNDWTKQIGEPIVIKDIKISRLY